MGKILKNDVSMIFCFKISLEAMLRQNGYSDFDALLGGGSPMSYAYPQKISRP